MITTTTASLRRASVTLGGIAAVAVLLTGCATPAQQQQANMQQDQTACSSMGARYGSPAYTQCMLQQQQRRDTEHLRFLEEARINSELARNAQKMREQRERNRRVAD